MTANQRQDQVNCLTGSAVVAVEHALITGAAVVSAGTGVVQARVALQSRARKQSDADAKAKHRK